MQPNNNIRSFSKQINELSFDVRAEVIISRLIQLGVDINQLRFDHIGSFYRPFRKDVSYSQIDPSSEHLHLKLSRNGMYDMLPEGLSHEQQTLQTGKKETIKTLVSSLKKQKKEEAKARTFFSPFEAFWLKYLVHLENEERHLIGDPQSKFEDFLKHFWELDKRLTLSQSIFLLSLMPYVSSIKGDLNEIIKGLELHLNKKVSYRKTFAPVSASKMTNDNRFVLGKNFVIGDLSDSLPHIDFRIDNVKDDEIPDYLPDGSVFYFITQYLSYLLPIEFEYTISVESNYEQNILGFGILGHSSQLKNPTN